MVDFYKWLSNNDPQQKVDAIVTTYKNNIGYFGLRWDEDDGWRVTDGLFHPDRLKDHFEEINYPGDVPQDEKRKLFKAIFKGSIKHI